MAVLSLIIVISEVATARGSIGGTKAGILIGGGAGGIPRARCMSRSICIEVMFKFEGGRVHELIYFLFISFTKNIFDTPHCK